MALFNANCAASPRAGWRPSSRIGNQKHYQANRDSPLFHELCSIIRKTVGLKEPVRAALQPLADKLKLALLYGSVAKQANTAASDIDLLLQSLR